MANFARGFFLFLFFCERDESWKIGFAGPQTKCAIEDTQLQFYKGTFANKYLEYTRDKTDLTVTNLLNKSLNYYSSQKGGGRFLSFKVNYQTFARRSMQDSQQNNKQNV